MATIRRDLLLFAFCLVVANVDYWRSLPLQSISTSIIGCELSDSSDPGSVNQLTWRDQSSHVNTIQADSTKYTSSSSQMSSEISSEMVATPDETTSADYIEGQVLLEEGNITYRVSCKTIEFLNRNETRSQEESRLIAAVLSHKFEARDTVRNTWAYNRSHHVWFVVAGSWESIEQEFVEKNDLLWLNVPESYRGITAKVQGLFAAIDTQLIQYEYILKTDDDSYVRMNNLLASTESDGKHVQSEYWGACNYRNVIIREQGHKWELPKEFLLNRQFYPPYAYGAGYVIKRPLVQCIVSQMNEIKVLPVEDAYIGAVVEICNGTCVDDHATFFPWYYMSWSKESKNRHWVLQHELKQISNMHRVHENTCCMYGHRDSISCQNVKCG